MRKPTVSDLLARARKTLMDRLISSATTPRSLRRTSSGVPADPVEFHHWMIKRLADARSATMRINRKPGVLLPAVGVLDDHLRAVSITHTDLDGISALETLPNLEKLEIIGTPIHDFSVLASLPNLRDLSLAYCTNGPLHVPDMPKLRSLKVMDTHGDITLGHLPMLDRAEFQVLGDLSQVTRQPCLTDLKVQKVTNGRFAPLAEAPNLRNLDIGLHEPEDLTALAALSKLEHLRLVQTGHADLSPVGALTTLRTLAIDGAKTTDFTALRSLTQLTHLRLRPSAQIADLSFLSGMTQLTELMTTIAASADLTVLTGLPQLNDLRLSDVAPDVNLAPIGNCTALENLFIRLDKDAPPQPLGPLPAPPNLLSFCIFAKSLTHLDGLQGCPNLQRISCTGSLVSTLDPLEGMAHLVQLELADTQVTDLSVLKTLPRFVAEDPDIRLSLKGAPVVDLYPQLKPSVALEGTRDGYDAVHRTALTAIRMLSAGD